MQLKHNKRQQADLVKLSPFLQKAAKMPPSCPNRCGGRYMQSSPMSGLVAKGKSVAVKHGAMMVASFMAGSKSKVLKVANILHRNDNALAVCVILCRDGGAIKISLCSSLRP